MDKITQKEYYDGLRRILYDHAKFWQQHPSDLPSDYSEAIQIATINQIGRVVERYIQKEQERQYKEHQKRSTRTSMEQEG